MTDLKRCPVSIHATLAGGDPKDKPLRNKATKFLSTPPSRVATVGIMESNTLMIMFLSTPPSRVATLLFECYKPTINKFLSTPPSRVATLAYQKATR